MTWVLLACYSLHVHTFLRPLLRERRTVAKVIECVEVHYEVQELEISIELFEKGEQS
ncbi:MAG: hypothetical protein QOI57_2389 [Rubrobacteraceae bacterium]|jgi:hypothetical protein|nr:hypothetical protein [Rubrobacteraceae bacterium]